MEKTTIYKVKSVSHSSTCVCYNKEDVLNMVGQMFDTLEIGDKISIKMFEMTEQETKELPEYDEF
jgi:hypothetical protein